jgi:hypothetical protein
MKKTILTSFVLLGIACLSMNSHAQTGWLLQGNSNATNSDFLGTTNNISLKFKTKNATRMVITGTGKVGIANSAPVSRLDILGLTSATEPVVNVTGKYVGSADVIAIKGTSTPSDTSGIGVQGVGNLAGVEGISNLFGVSGSGIIGVLGSSAVAGTTGFPTGVWGQSDGGEQGNGVFGIAENSTQNISVWGIATDTATVGGVRDYAGYFQGNVFGYRFFQLSDERMKKNVQPLHSVLSRLMNVQTATYNYKTAEFPKLHLPAGLQTGFLAENLQQQFPDMVVETTMPEKIHPKTGRIISEKADVKVVNYMGMIPVLTSAIQEQQVQIAAKDAAIADMQKQLVALENRLSRLEANSPASGKTGVSLSDVRLDQNQPNPFSNSTLINFELPDNTSDARIMITTMDGKLIREISINGNKSGQVQLSAVDMSAGSYLYSLYVNGAMTATKTLVITK